MTTTRAGPPRREGTVLLLIGIALMAFWLVATASLHALGGFAYVALFLGSISIFVSLVTRYRSRG
jgi:hypothetical protein